DPGPLDSDAVEQPPHFARARPFREAVREGGSRQHPGAAEAHSLPFFDKFDLGKNLPPGLLKVVVLDTVDLYHKGDLRTQLAQQVLEDADQRGLANPP